MAQYGETGCDVVARCQGPGVEFAADGLGKPCNEDRSVRADSRLRDERKTGFCCGYSNLYQLHRAKQGKQKTCEPDMQCFFYDRQAFQPF